MIGPIRKFTVIVVTGGILAGCSVTDLSAPINEMSTAVEGSARAIEQLDTKLTAAMNESWRADILSGDARLRPANGSCSVDVKMCSLVVKVRGGEWTAYPVTSVMPKAHVGLAALKGYVGALRAIVDADTAGKVTASANEALGSLKNLEDQIANARGTTPSGLVETYEQPTSEAIKWFVGQYVAAVKYRALAKATASADPVIAELALYHEDLAKSLSDTELADASLAYQTKRNEFDRKARAKTLAERDITTFVAAASDYDKILKASHSKPLKAFADAHAKVTKTLNGDEITLSEAISYIKMLKEEAKTFQGLVENFTNLNEEAK